MPIRVLLADDHAMVRQGLKALLEQQGVQVICEAADGEETLRLAKEFRPDIAILDISMPILNGIDAAREMKRSLTETKVLLLTQHTEDEYVTEALRAGVHGYVLKNQAAEDLLHAIQEITQGSTYISPSIAGTVVGAYLSKKQGMTDPLSSRERQVLQFVGEGRSTKEIAEQMQISVKTVESHRTRLMRKLKIHGTASLVRYAIRRGMIQA
jgi:DNA-binding NarL/FixJ family response regulator